MQISINNRHKAGVFLTTVVAGLCLILGEGFRESLGVIIIGIALTWALGSKVLALRWAIALLSFAVMLTPLTFAAFEHRRTEKIYQRSLEAFQSQLRQYANNLKKNEKEDGPWTHYQHPFPAGSYVFYDVPNLGSMAFPAKQSLPQVASDLRSNTRHSEIPDWYLSALDAGVNPNEAVWLAIPEDKPPTFKPFEAIMGGWPVEVPATILLIAFAGTAIIDWRKSRLETSV